MQVNASNALLVAALFDKLADERFNMRTIAAIRASSFAMNVSAEESVDQNVLDLATQIGCPILTRIRDGAPLIARPIVADGSRRMTHLECRAMSDRAAPVATGGEAFDLPTFRVTFAPPPPEPAGDDTVGEE